MVSSENENNSTNEAVATDSPVAEQPKDFNTKMKHTVKKITEKCQNSDYVSSLKDKCKNFKPSEHFNAEKSSQFCQKVYKCVREISNEINLKISSLKNKKNAADKSENVNDKSGDAQV